MNLDIKNELYFVNIAPGEFMPNKLDCMEGEDPIEWLRNELKRKPAKVINKGLIVGVATDVNPDDGNLAMVFYAEPIPVMTDKDWDELAESLEKAPDRPI